MANKEPVKNRLKAKKEEMKNRVKGKAKKASCVILGGFLAMLCGCATSEPASRVTNAEYGDIVVKIEACSNITVKVTLGDGALSSSDSAGSTETNTSSPTNTTDIKPDVDVNTTGGKSAGVLESAISAFTGGSGSSSTTTTTSSTSACTNGCCVVPSGN